MEGVVTWIVGHGTELAVACGITGAFLFAACVASWYRERRRAARPAAAFVARMAVHAEARRVADAATTEIPVITTALRRPPAQPAWAAEDNTGDATSEWLRYLGEDEGAAPTVPPRVPEYEPRDERAVPMSPWLAAQLAELEAWSAKNRAAIGAGSVG